MPKVELDKHVEHSTPFTIGGTKQGDLNPNQEAKSSSNQMESGLLNGTPGNQAEAPNFPSKSGSLTSPEVASTASGDNGNKQLIQDFGKQTKWRIKANLLQEV